MQYLSRYFDAINVFHSRPEWMPFTGTLCESQLNVQFSIFQTYTASIYILFPSYMFYLNIIEAKIYKTWKKELILISLILKINSCNFHAIFTKILWSWHEYLSRPKCIIRSAGTLLPEIWKHVMFRILNYCKHRQTFYPIHMIDVKVGKTWKRIDYSNGSSRSMPGVLCNVYQAFRVFTIHNTWNH